MRLLSQSVDGAQARAPAGVYLAGSQLFPVNIGNTFARNTALYGNE